VTEELLAAVREAIKEATHPDDLLNTQAQAAAEAVVNLGFVQSAGWEYALRRGDVLEAQSFNTREQLDAWARAQFHLGPDEALPAGFVVVRRPVGFWEVAPD
jgi:hypothetical protein